MKTLFHARAFLSNYRFKTPLDEEMVNSFLDNRYGNAPRSLRNAPNFDERPLDVQSFIQWFENGSEAFKTAFFENRLVMLGNCRLGECPIIASLGVSGGVQEDSGSAHEEDLSQASELERDRFLEAMRRAGLQPDFKTLGVSPRYEPRKGERVAFHDLSLSRSGAGVFRGETGEGRASFYCYCLFNPQEGERAVGHSLREDPGIRMHAVVFESLEEDNAQTMLGNSTHLRRRLYSAIEQEGKAWRQRLLRAEPLGMEKRGGKYYYVSDSLSVIAGRDNGTRTAHNRYLAGNYFHDPAQAMRVASAIREALGECLSSPRWPQCPKGFLLDWE